MGFRHVYVMTQGITAWLKNGYPVKKFEEKVLGSIKITLGAKSYFMEFTNRYFPTREEKLESLRKWVDERLKNETLEEATARWVRAGLIDEQGNEAAWLNDPKISICHFLLIRVLIDWSRGIAMV